MIKFRGTFVNVLWIFGVFPLSLMSISQTGKKLTKLFFFFLRTIVGDIFQCLFIFSGVFLHVH